MRKGSHMTDEQRARISAGRSGIRQPQATLDHLAALRRTPEFRERARLSKLGRKQTPDEKARQILAQTGKPGWAKGRVLTPEHRTRIGRALKGRVCSPELRAKLSVLGRARHPRTLVNPGRDHSEYYAWKRAVHGRDDYLCTMCGSGPLTGQDCHADHLLPWVAYPEYRYIVFLGRTLCRKCHVRWTAYQRERGLLKRDSTPIPTHFFVPRTLTPSERLAAKTEVRGECRVWTGRAAKNGYAPFTYGGRLSYAHRFAYEMAHGPIAKKMIRNTCGERLCVAPTHWRAA